MNDPKREGRFEALANKKVRIVWLTPLDASARRWSDLKDHRLWADQTLAMLREEISAVQSAVEATEISSEL